MWRFGALIAVCALGVGVRAQSTVYPIDWTMVPSSANGPGSPDNPCQCNLTVHRCDPNCYCDTECTAAQTARFSAALPAGVPSAGVFMCVDPSLVTVNDRGEVTSAIIDNLLCITKSNNPSEGNFFDDPGQPCPCGASPCSCPALSTGATQLPYTYETALTTSRTCNADGGYMVGDTIAGAVAVSVSPVTLQSVQIDQYFPLPSRDHANECSNANAPRFLQNVLPGRDARCFTYVTAADLAAKCTTDLDGQRFVTNLYAARTCSPSLADPTTYVAVQVGSIVHRTAAGDAPTGLSAVPAATMSGGVCQNAVLEVAYVFDYTTSAVTAVTANVVLGDVSISTGNFVSVQRQFTVQWNETGAIANSGSPGYLPGLPLLAGTVATQGSQSAVSRLVDGLQVLGTTDGVCNTSGTLHTVRSHQDAYFSCTLPLTLAELQTYCQSGLAAAFLSYTATVVGQWGDSDFNDVTEWVYISKPSSSITNTYIAAQRRCAATVNTLYIEVLTADVGNVLAPQRKILAVSSTPASSEWVFTNADPTVPQNFPVVVTVTMVPYGGSASERLPAVPPVLPSLPADVLYPLYIDSSPAPRARAPLALSAALLVLLALAAG